MTIIGNPNYSSLKSEVKSPTVIGNGRRFLEAHMTSMRNGLQTIVTRGPSGTGFWVDWGDGSLLELVQHTGIGNSITTTHTYSSSGPWAQKWIGDLSSITYLDLQSEDYSFDLSSLSSMINLSNLYLNGSPLINGNLSSFSGMQLVVLRLFGCPLIEGNLSDLSSMISMTSLYLHGCVLVEGNLSSLSSMTSMGVLSLHGCALIEGDIGSLASMVSVSTLALYDCPLFIYTTTALPQWNNAVLNFSSCGLSTVEIDALIYDLWNVPIKTGGSVNLAGTNANRTTGPPNDTIYLPDLATAGCPVASNP